MINRIFQITAAGRRDPAYSVHNELKSNLGIRERQLFDISPHVGGLSHSCFEKLCPCRGVIKNITHNYCGAVRCTDLLVQLFPAALYDIADRCEFIALFRNQNSNPQHS